MYNWTNYIMYNIGTSIGRRRDDRFTKHPKTLRQSEAHHPINIRAQHHGDSKPPYLLVAHMTTNMQAPKHTFRWNRVLFASMSLLWYQCGFQRLFPMHNIGARNHHCHGEIDMPIDMAKAIDKGCPVLH